MRHLKLEHRLGKLEMGFLHAIRILLVTISKLYPHSVVFVTLEQHLVDGPKSVLEAFLTVNPKRIFSSSS